ncbi:MAG: ribbon-helix-helix protein, CopG family [Acidobacteria bacterium]|nr:ribbon-helix-helix protein, CopG family [Acidobacteriota bacterium]
MKTTLMIDDGVMKRLRQEAARRGTTISALVEGALRLFLESRARPAPSLPPLPSFDGGGAAVDISDRDALYRAMEGR